MRGLKFSGKLLLGAVALVLSVALIVLVFPSTILNTKTLIFAVRHFGGDYRPTWTRLTLRVRSPGLLTKRASLEARDLCVNEVHGAANGCLSVLELDATIRLGLSPVFAISRFERLVVHAGDLRLDSTAGPTPPPKRKPRSGAPLVPAWATLMTLGTVDVRVPRAVLVASSGTTTAGVSAAFRSESSAPLTAEAYTMVKGTGIAPAKRYDVRLTLDSDLFREGRLTALDATIRLRGGGISADARAKIEPRAGDRLKLTASAKAALSGRVLEAELDGEGGKEGGRAFFNAAVSDPKGKISRAAFESCKAEAGLGRKNGGLERADLDCRITIQPASFGVGKGPKPKALTGTLSIHGKNRARTARRDRFETRLEARLGPAKGYGGFSLGLDADLAGPAGGSPVAERRVSVRAAVERFGELVRFLDGTEYAVPAPINAFDGTIKAAAEISGRGEDKRQDLEFNVRTDLTSAKQALITAVKGKAALSPPGAKLQIKVETDVDLERVVLQLPYLELKSAPSPLTDKRIKTGDPARDAAVEATRKGTVTPQTSGVDYDVSIRTLTPMILSSNLIKAPVPISVRLRAKPEGLSGTLRVEGFDMEVFRQNATIDHITLTPGLKGASTALDGKIIYKRNEVTVNILLLGSTAKPTIVFESDPPMTQNEIVALVLYGKSPNELDSDQKASAGNATAAMTNGAFGLASLYLFASTPVDSVGYDPASQSYQVKFKLPGGATLSVGSDLAESRTLSLRKRLSRHWELQTEAARGTREGQAITTFLQWFERY